MTDKGKTEEMISYTNKEVKVWAKAGLIPENLLKPSEKIELFNYIRSNKKKLYAHYKEDSKEDKYQITIPPPNELNKAYELQVIEKKTGKVVKILEQRSRFNLCDNVILEVKAKELEQWEKETIAAKQLTKEQSKNLETFVKEKKPLTRQEIVTFIEEIQKPRKPTKYRQSGHLVDEKLKYTKPNQQYNLFNIISPETKQKIEEARTEVKAEGIKLTAPENKIINTLNQILHEKSQTQNPNKPDFYIGNSEPISSPYGSNPKQKAPVLKFKPAELYKAYTGKDCYSGADILFINKTLHQVEAKKFLIKYDRIKKIKNGKKLTDRIEEFSSLIKILAFYPNLTEEEKKKLDNGDTTIWKDKGEIVVAFNPIFTDQIDTKFIEFPVDTNRRLVIAAGGHKKVTASTMTLMEYLLREMSAKRCHSQINEDNLQCMLGLEKYVKEKRKKRLQERIEKDIQAMINMGIVLSCEKLPNALGNIKYIFHLNKDYE